MRLLSASRSTFLSRRRMPEWHAHWRSPCLLRHRYGSAIAPRLPQLFSDHVLIKIAAMPLPLLGMSGILL